MARTILSWPQPDRANPYLFRLGDALAQHGVRTRSEKYLAGLCARPRGAPWLHLHWPEWMTHDPSRIRYRARVMYLLGLLDLARAQGVTLAWTAHNLLGHDDPHPDLGTDARRALLQRCSVVFGHFAGAEADVRDLGFRGRFAVTPHPHYAADYPLPDRASARRALKLSPTDTFLVSAGTVLPYKNLPSFARAFRAAAPARGFRWRVTGHPADTTTVNELTRAVDGDPRIDLAFGFAPPPLLAQTLVAADAVVLPYRAFYTSGASVLALTLGTPVVGPPRHHLATLLNTNFFVPLDGLDSGTVSAALASVRALAPSARTAARAHALAADWPSTAAVIATTLFGPSA